MILSSLHSPSPPDPPVAAPVPPARRAVHPQTYPPQAVCSCVVKVRVKIRSEVSNRVRIAAKFKVSLWVVRGPRVVKAKAFRWM